MVFAEVIPALMDQTVMSATQQHRVVQTRFAAIGPVADVVRVHEARVPR